MTTHNGLDDEELLVHNWASLDRELGRGPLAGTTTGHRRQILKVDLGYPEWRHHAQDAPRHRLDAAVVGQGARVGVDGLEHASAIGPCVVVSNHRSGRSHYP